MIIWSPSLPSLWSLILMPLATLHMPCIPAQVFTLQSSRCPPLDLRSSGTTVDVPQGLLGFWHAKTGSRPLARPSVPDASPQGAGHLWLLGFKVGEASAAGYYDNQMNVKNTRNTTHSSPMMPALRARSNGLLLHRRAASESGKLIDATILPKIQPNKPPPPPHSAPLLLATLVPPNTRRSRRLQPSR